MFMFFSHSVDYIANVLVETTNQQIEYQERIEAVPAVATDGNIDVDETGDELLYEDDEGIY